MTFKRPNPILLLLLMSLLTFACQKEKGPGKKSSIDKRVIEKMVLIPAGEFIMGSNEVDTEMMQQRFGMTDIPYQNEHPERRVHLDYYYIDRFEATNEEYKELKGAF